MGSKYEIQKMTNFFRGGGGSILNFRSDSGWTFGKKGISKVEVLKTNTDLSGKDE